DAALDHRRHDADLRHWSPRLVGPGTRRAHHRGARRERAYSCRQPGNASRADDGPRGDGAGVLRTPSGHDRARRSTETAALYVDHRLHLRALGSCLERCWHHGVRHRPRHLSRQARSWRLPARLLSNLDCQNAGGPGARIPRDSTDARIPRHLAAVRFAELLMEPFALDIAHLLAGGLVLISFLLLYQDRMFGLLNIFALHAVVLSLSIAWQAHVQNAPHLFVPAAIALILKVIIIPVALHRVVVKLGIHRQIETVGGIGPTMLAGLGLVALSMVVMLRATEAADPLARQDLAFALSVILLGLLMMVTRRNAVSQVIGFLSIENGLILAATGAKGMP